MSHLGSVQCPIIVGRDDLLDLADRRLSQAGGGQGQLLLLAGEAGIGKSRLLDGIRRKARAAGFLTANGSLAPQDQNVPLALVMELARTLRQKPAFGSLGDDLLAMQRTPDADALGSRRLLVLDIVDRILAGLDRSVMLDFEDLQWADEVSLEIVGELARRSRERPVLLVGAYRADELAPASYFREWRARLIGQRLAEEVRLSPLTYEQTALMTTLILATGLPAPREVVAAVYERTDGIPLHIEELLGALGEDARADGHKIRDAVVPDTIEDAILARIARLSPEAQAVARAGAVIGRCFIPAVLAGVMDRPLGDLEGPLDELTRESYLYIADPGYLDYRHQVLRDVLYRSVPAADLRRFHARAAEFGVALSGQSEVHASVHFERAGMRAQAYRTALAGAKAAAALVSRGESFDLYARAVANIPEDIPALELAELYSAYCEAALAVDDVAVSDETAELARRYYLEADRPLEAAWSLSMRSAMARRDVRLKAERLAYLDQAEAELAVLPDTPERAFILSDILVFRAIVALDTIRLDEAAAILDEARRLKLASTDPDTGDIDFTAAEIDVLAGRPEVGLAAMLQVARHGRDAQQESTGVTAYRTAAAFAVRVMDYATADIGIREGLRYADEIEQSYCRHVLAATSAHVAWARGQWDEAIPIAGIEIVERGSRRGTLGSRDALGYVAFGRGEVDRARSLLGESLAIGRDGAEVELILPPLWGLAETALVAGGAAVAIALCDEALALALATGERPLLVPFVVTGVRANLAERRPEAAERWLEAVTGHLVDWEFLARPALDHADGLIRLAAGSTVAARQALEAAVRGWEARERTWETAWARLDLAQCLLRANRVGEAASNIATVRAWAEGIGSEPLVARADELTRLGRGRGGLDEPWWPLTTREFEVARLVADGLTNGEIADALTIAPKTASAHIEHILAKLSVTRRAEIAAWAATVLGKSVTPAQDDARSAVAARR